MQASRERVYGYLMRDTGMAGWDLSGTQFFGAALWHMLAAAALAQQDNAIVISSKAGGPGGRAEPHSIGNKWQTGHRPEWVVRCFPLLPPTGSLTGSPLSLCSMNSAKFKRVCVTSAMSWEVRASFSASDELILTGPHSAQASRTQMQRKEVPEGRQGVGDKCWKCPSCL